MTTSTHTDWINKLAAAVRPYGWTEKSIDGYLIALGDLPVEALGKAVGVSLRTRDRMPAPSELRRDILHMIAPDGPPHVDAAWVEVETQMSKCGAMRKADAVWSHPLVGQAVDESISWANACRAPNLIGQANAFRRTYDNLVSTEERATLISNSFEVAPAPLPELEAGDADDF